MQNINTRRGVTQIKRVDQALPDNAPKGHLAAFTLIELLIVVFIIAVLTMIAMPQYKIAVAKSRYVELMSLANSIKNAQELYYLAHGKYATSFGQLDIDMPAGGSEIAGTLTYPNGNQFEVIHDQGTRVYARNITQLCNNYEIPLDHNKEKNSGYKEYVSRFCYVSGAGCDRAFGRKVCRSLGWKATDPKAPDNYFPN